MINYGFLGGGRLVPQRVKHRVFISYHHHRDQVYYDAFSRAFHDDHEVIYDNSLERRIDSDNVDYVVRRIRENYIVGSSCTIVLVGSETWGRKYVDWEISATLEKAHGLVGVYLPSAARDASNRVLVPGRLFDNIESRFAPWLSWQDLTESAAQLDRHIVEAKGRSTAPIVNARERRLRNA